MVLDHEVQLNLSINILEIFHEIFTLILTAENKAKINGKKSKNPSMPLFVKIFQILHPKAYTLFFFYKNKVYKNVEPQI